MSLPTRGAWIEIEIITATLRRGLLSLPTRGAWIEMDGTLTPEARFDGRSPHGERGLKYVRNKCFERSYPSLPTRGAWIEISRSNHRKGERQSLPTRGAWIEMVISEITLSIAGVAPHTGSVD